MKKIFVIAALIAALALSGCAKNEKPAETPADTSAPVQEEAPAKQEDAAPEIIFGDPEGTANDNYEIEIDPDFAVGDDIMLIPGDGEDHAEDVENFVGSFDIEYSEELAAAFGALSDGDFTDAPFEGSLTEAYLVKLATCDSFRIVMAAADVRLEIAASGTDKTRMSMYSDDISSTVIMDGMSLISYDPNDGEAYKFTIGSAEEAAEYSREEIMSGAVGTPYSADSVRKASLECGGASYNAEEYDGCIYLYGADGNIAFVYDGEDCFAIRADYGVPDSVFALPDGIEVIDYDSIFGELMG